MIDSGCVIISYDALNGDGTTTSLPLIMDDVLWTQYRNSTIFTRAALAGNVNRNPTMANETTFPNSNETTAWTFAPEAKSYPDENSTASFGQKDVAILKDPAGTSSRESSVNGNIINESASLVSLRL